MVSPACSVLTIGCIAIVTLASRMDQKTSGTEKVNQRQNVFDKLHDSKAIQNWQKKSNLAVIFLLLQKEKYA